MKSQVLDRITDPSGAAQLEVGVGRAKDAVLGAVEDGVATTRRGIRKMWHAADDLFDDAEHHARRHPLSAPGIALGVGLGLGAVIGFLLSRNLCSAR